MAGGAAVRQAGRPDPAGLADPVERLSVHHLQLPVSSPRDHGSGLVAGDVEVVLVRLETRSGVTGWGEASPWSVFTGTAEQAAAALDRYLRPVVIGADTAEIPAIMAKAEVALTGHPEAKAALETALYDCRGRLLGLPVHALLGGRFRDRIALSVSLANPDFNADLALLERLAADGVGIVKVKTGASDHRFDLMRLERLRADFPEMDVRVDYNQGMAPHEARRRLADIDTFDVTFIEQPVPRTCWAAMADLTRAFHTPILADESVFGPDEAVWAVNKRFCDLISVKLMKAGGLRRGMAVAAIAEAAGMACYGGDMFET
ncbi:MAG TPA: enolase C-terminal domain-like protein, partial [Afifellaceae bacterium]|nr:enolase C-terminal domain-like protein [Afifellaceae bacterium]